MLHSRIEFKCNNIYIIGDLHLAIDIENKSMDKFPFYKDYLSKIDKTLSRLTDEDILIVCGDICWGKRIDDAIPSLNYLDKFKGKKILFKGNHDYWFEKLTKLNSMYESLFFIKNKEVIINNIPFVMHKGYYVNEDELDENDIKLLNRELVRIKNKVDVYKKEGYNTEDIVVTLHYQPILQRDINKYENNRTLNILNYILDEGIGRCYYGHLHSDFGLLEKVDDVVRNTTFKCVSADLVNFNLVKIL